VLIPLPSIEEQRKNVSKLDMLTELIALKKEAIGKTESLTKSVFLEMFGDPLTNSK
jgi:type I restriction enzyme S subunit